MPGPNVEQLLKRLHCYAHTGSMWGMGVFLHLHAVAHTQMKAIYNTINVAIYLRCCYFVSQNMH